MSTAGFVARSSAMFLPPLTQRRIQVHLRYQLRQPVTDQALLRGEQRALRIEERQVAVHANPVTVFGQVVVTLVRCHQVALCLQLPLVGGTCRQPVGDFLERALNGLFVLDYSDVLAGD